jgi:lysophospholipid acyltransferase (LPLAT)-like uncharacterized protein
MLKSLKHPEVRLMENVFKKKVVKNSLRSIAAVVVPALVYLLLHLFWFTSKKKFHGIDRLQNRQSVVVSWHAELLMIPLFYNYWRKKEAKREKKSPREASVIVSKHFDGEMLAKLFMYLNITPMRGSTKKGAKEVLFASFRSAKNGNDILISPDGPRGPRHQLQNGAIAIALKMKLPIKVLNYKPHSYWQLGSWDKMIIPKPFTQLDFYCQEYSVDGMELEEAKEYIQKRLMENTIV